MSEEIIKQICRGLSKYYKSLGKQYEVNDDGKGIFEVFCDDNGLDETIEDELKEDVEQCMLVDFDEDFPLKKPMNDDAKKKFILQTINDCARDPDIEFNKDLPSCYVLFLLFSFPHYSISYLF